MHADLMRRRAVRVPLKQKDLRTAGNRFGPDRAELLEFSRVLRWLVGRSGNYNVRVALKSMVELAVVNP